MSKLMYAATDSLMSHNQINHLSTPPALGARHHPYAFGDYISDVKEALDKQGLEIVAEEFALSNENMRMFGMFEVTGKDQELTTAEDWSINVGIRGSHDQSIPRGLALGTSVMVCSNLCFHGNIGNTKGMQTTNVVETMAPRIAEAISHVPELAQRQESRFEAMQGMEFNQRHGDAALVELYRRGAFTNAQLAKAITEWLNPSYEEHAAGGYTVWQLFNACTEALKPSVHNNRFNMDAVRERSEIVDGFVNELIKL